MTVRFRHPRRWVLAVVLVVLGVPAVALAQSQLLGGKFRTGDEVVIPAGEELTGDLYASGGSIRVEGTVEGDLVATGGRVAVTGEVGGDVIAGAGTVEISGQVGGDVRAGAGQVTVDGSIGEDLLVGSGMLTIEAGGEIGEDLVFGTGSTTLAGRVVGDVLGSTGTYDRTGEIGGTEDVRIDQGREREEPAAADRVLDALRRFVVLLVLGTLLLWIAPAVVEGPAGALRRRPWASLGIGVLGILGIVVAFFAIILAMVLLSLLFGLVTLGELVGLTIFIGIVALVLLVFLAYVVFAYLAQLVVAMSVGRLAFRGDSRGQRWAALALGVVVVVVLTSLPVVGGWLGFLIVLFGLGAILIALNSLRRRPPATPLPPPPQPTMQGP
ncbi:MAG TPA: polymer-forming cytoskeletal protein [Actinomycetota bacterium]|nr:polymer-forming cytoskeletal protein [Actinomycetota bacterium]